MTRVFLLLIFACAPGIGSPFVGTWEFDKELTKKADFKIQDISKIKERTSYIDYSKDGAMIVFSVFKMVDGTTNTYHWLLYPDGRVTQEYSKAKGIEPYERFQTKKIDERTYRFFGVPLDPVSGKEIEWNGTFQVSENGKYLSLKAHNLSDASYDYFYVVLKRVQ